MMDASSGYISWSMSKRAAQAYADGEMPKSKWTKAAMAEAIKVCCDENDLAYDPAVERLAKTALFDRFFYRSSWHHTSKFFNATDFYAVDEDAVMAAFRPMTGEELAARDAALAEHIREAREAYERQQARCSDMEAYRKEHGFRPDSAAAFMLVHPERCHERIARKSHNRHVCFEHGGMRYDVAVKDAKSKIVDGFNALDEAAAPSPSLKEACRQQRDASTQLSTTHQDVPSRTDELGK